MGDFGFCSDDISSRRHIRQIWFVGAALLGIGLNYCCLIYRKVGTLTRVISLLVQVQYACDCLSCTVTTTIFDNQKES